MFSLGQVVAFFALAEIQQFFLTYVAEKVLDGVVGGIANSIRSRVNKDSIEQQLLESLETALEETCKHFSWEYDFDALTDTFFFSCSKMNGIHSEEALRTILENAVGVKVDTAVLEAWLYHFHVEVTKPKHSWLYNLVVLNDILEQSQKLKAMEGILRSLQITAIKDVILNAPGYVKEEEETEGYDAYLELANAFDKLFGAKDCGNNDKDEEDGDPHDNDDDFSKLKHEGDALARFQFQNSVESQGQQESLKYISDDEITELLQYECTEPVVFGGRHFTIFNPSNVKAVMFEVMEFVHPISRETFLFPIELPHVIEELDFGNTKSTFFVDRPKEEGNHLVLLSFDTEQKIIHINTGILDGNKVSFKQTPVLMEFRKKQGTPNDLVRWGLGLVECEPEESAVTCNYSFNITRPITIMDPETAEIVLPIFYYDKDSYDVKGKIHLFPYKSYFAFELVRTPNKTHYLCEYDMGIGYQTVQYGLPFSLYKAWKWFSIAAESGDDRAFFELGMMYLYGWGIMQNERKAFDLFLQSADMNNDEAMLRLGIMYRDGTYVNQDKEAAYNWFLKAANEGSSAAQCCLGYLFLSEDWEKSNDSEAFLWFLKSAEQGDIDAAYEVGESYYHGYGTEQDYSLAYEWYLKAAEKNHATAKNQIGNMLVDGKGGEKDFVTAFRYFSDAYKNGNYTACNNLGWMFKAGCGVSQNYMSALTLFEKASKNGRMMSYKHIGDLYLNGWGVEQNTDTAIENYQIASDGGIALATLVLAEIFEDDTYSVKDVGRSLHYYELAKEQGKDVDEKILKLEQLAS